MTADKTAASVACGGDLADKIRGGTCTRIASNVHIHTYIQLHVMRHIIFWFFVKERRQGIKTTHDNPPRGGLHGLPSENRCPGDTRTLSS